MPEGFSFSHATRVKTGSATIMTGNTFVTVNHGLGYTPNISKFVIQGQADLGGRIAWVDTITATQFNINMSSMDLGNLVFTYHIIC